MSKRPKKERKQVGLELSSKLNDLLESAVAAFGGSRASNAIEVLDLCLPIWIEIKRQQKSCEHEQMRAALEIALSKFTGDHEQMRAAVETALRKRFGELPETGEKEQDEGTVAPRRRRK
jgi:hypothetical protein